MVFFIALKSKHFYRPQKHIFLNFSDETKYAPMGGICHVSINMSHQWVYDSPFNWQARVCEIITQVQLFSECIFESHIIHQQFVLLLVSRRLKTPLVSYKNMPLVQPILTSPSLGCVRQIVENPELHLTSVLDLGEALLKCGQSEQLS